MTKLLRQVFGIWTTGTKFDPQHKSKEEKTEASGQKDQVTFDQVLAAIGQAVRGASQHRGPCPLHETESTDGRPFSVNLKRNIFRCFDSACRAQGNVLEFWMAYRQLPLYEAAGDLARTLRIELPTNQHYASKTKKTKGKKTAGITPPSPWHYPVYLTGTEE